LTFDSRAKSLSWESATLLIQSATRLDEYERPQLDDAVSKSDLKLSPLSEPLKLNLGSHRWLRSDREESYSDWLAWILQGMLCREILTLFGVDDGIPVEPFVEIHRERWSLYGRTDIEVRFGDRGFLLVEIKVREPGGELASQLKRYTQMVDKRPEAHKRLVLVGLEAPVHIIEPFTFTSWTTICERLRRYACRLRESETLRAAAMLIFCGAVEQNLLGFSIRPSRLGAMTTVDYLRRWHEET